jgi:TonB family protein
MRTVAVPVACTPPKYPKTSIRFGEAPVVGLAFLIDANGAVLKARIVETSGAKIIDDSTRVALSRCTYPPIRVAGKAVGGWVYVRYEWVIE